MTITRIHRFLIAKTSKYQVGFWLTSSILFTLFYSFLDLKQAFSNTYVVQDDARVYVSWMQRFLEPDLLAGDLISDYFQSVTPAGYTALYQVMASAGVEPLVLSKILPICLRSLTTGYAFALSLKILPIPLVGFISTLLLNQYFSLRDDLVSSTPRSFIYLFFLAFLYYLLRRSFGLFLVAIALAGLFYPPLLLILAGILFLRLWRWEGKLPQLSKNKLDYLFGIAGLGLSLLIMLPYALSSSKFGPVVSGIEARALPAFSQTGRIPFFSNNSLWFWLFGQHSGLLPNVLEHPLAVLGLLLPIVIRYSYRFPLAKQINSNIKILSQTVIASLIIFAAAHILLYKLFAPARYTRYTLRIVLIMAAAIVLVVFIDVVFRWIKQQAQTSGMQQFLALGLIVPLGVALISYPKLLHTFPCSNYIVGQAPRVYEFFRQQPKDIIIASVSEEADNLPTFAQRAILVGWEYAVPYHVDYDRQIRERATALIRAQYTQSLAELQTFIEQYSVDFFLLDRTAFTPEYLTTNPWLKQWKAIAKDILVTLQQDTTLVLASSVQQCSVLETENLIVLKAECVAKGKL